MMKRIVSRGRIVGAVAVAAVALLAVVTLLTTGVIGTTLAGSGGQWTQWGGPHHDFKANSSGIASKWSKDGPKKLWGRDLGDGYSAILVDGDKLYTMYRSEDQEAVVCLDASNGKTVWEHRYDSGPKEGHVTQFGEGPRATPLIVGNTIYTIGVSGMMHALNKTNGEEQWSHDLWGEEFGGNFLNHGYSSSPIEYKNTIVALVGGEGSSVVAFNKKNGKVAWKSLDFQNSYSTPRVLEVNGKDQLITFMATEAIGVDPSNGKLLWSFPHENQWKQNINMPIVIDNDKLFLSATEAGAKGLQLTPDGDTYKVEELWSTRKIQFYHVTTVSEGDWVYGSTGSMAPAFMAAINMRTGEIGWRERGMAKANVVWADGKLIVLDEDGKIYLTTATPEGLEVHSEFELLESVSWTVPTVVGNKMYVRDKKQIMALDLG